MKAVAFATVISTASAGGSLSLSFKDCGAKHAVTTDVQPTTLQLGADTAITGTGSLDKAVSGGTYDMELKAGGGLIDSHFTGNNCEAKDFTLPLGLGTLSWDGIKCPLAAADSVAIGFHTKLASSLPAALATSDIHLAANDQDGESVLCVDLHLAKQKTISMQEDLGMGGQVFMEGFLEGFIGDATHIKACVRESVEVAKDVKHLVKDVKSRNLNKTMHHFEALVSDAMADVKACRAIGKDLAPFMAAFKGVHSIKGLAKRLKNNFLAHDAEILDLLEDMLDVCTFGAPDGHKCGVDAGKQMRSLVIGDRLVSTLQDVLEGDKSAFADFLEGFTGDSKLSDCVGQMGKDGGKNWADCRDLDKDDMEVGPLMAGLTDVHGVKDIVHAILNALKQHFLDHDGEILDLLGDMTKVCTFAAPDGHKCAADMGRIARSILFGNTGNQIVRTLQDNLESNPSAFADFLEGFTGDSKLSECVGKIGMHSTTWEDCKDMDKDDKDLGTFMAGVTDVHGVKDIVHAILNALKQHFLDHDGEILDLLGDMTKVCTFAAPDGHKCAADMGRIVRSILFGNAIVV